MLGAHRAAAEALGPRCWRAARCSFLPVASRRLPLGAPRSITSRTETASKAAAAARAAQQAQAARDEGAVPVGTILAIGGGIGAGGWYAGLFDSVYDEGSWYAGWSKGDKFASWLTSKGVAVVVFELDGVMHGTRQADSLEGAVVPRHELEDYLAGVSEDFVEAVHALARHDFALAVATRGDVAACSSHGRSPQTHIAGAALAKALLARWCPDALPRFKMILDASSALPADKRRQLLEQPQSQQQAPPQRRSWFGSRGAAPSPDSSAAASPVKMERDVQRREQLKQIAGYYDIPYSHIAVVDLSFSAADDGWMGVPIQVKKPGIGFMFTDCEEAGCGSAATERATIMAQWLPPALVSMLPSPGDGLKGK